MGCWRVTWPESVSREVKDLKIYIDFSYSTALWALRWQPSHPSANHSKSWLFGPELQHQTHNQPDPMYRTEQPEIGPWSGLSGVFTSSTCPFFSKLLCWGGKGTSHKRPLCSAGNAPLPYLQTTDQSSEPPLPPMSSSDLTGMSVMPPSTQH